MERFIQHEPLFIRHFTALKWPFPLHNHNHYELVFIPSGRGYHVLNHNKRPYHGPCVFVLAPADFHIFEIEEETEFVVLKFSNVYLGGSSGTQSEREWNKLMDQLIAVSAIDESELIQSPEDLDKLVQLMQLIVKEWETPHNSAGEFIFHLIRAAFALIKRSAISKFNDGDKINNGMMMNVLDYIHSHIHQSRDLHLTELAQLYNLSPNYLNHIFKQQMGVSIRQYINLHKFKLIETRLKHSSLSIKTISDEFGFNDLSHFNKFLKRQSGHGPKTIKNA